MIRIISSSSASPNVRFIDLAKRQTIYITNRERRLAMINQMIAFHYVLNVYHVNSVGGIEDIKRYRELPLVLLGSGRTYRVHPYWAHEDTSSVCWDTFVWAKLYDEGMKTESIKIPLIDSYPTNRTYIDIIAEGVDYHGNSRRVRAVFKIIDENMCELWWLNGSIKEQDSFTVIENYKSFCEMEMK